MQKFVISAAAVSLIAVLAASAGAQTKGSALVFAVTANPATPADRLVGQTVYNDKGQGVGSIVEVVPNGRTAEPTAIMSVLDTVGVGSRLVAVPLSHVGFDRSKASMSGFASQAVIPEPANNMNWLAGGGG